VGRAVKVLLMSRTERSENKGLRKQKRRRKGNSSEIRGFVLYWNTLLGEKKRLLSVS